MLCAGALTYCSGTWYCEEAATYCGCERCSITFQPPDERPTAWLLLLRSLFLPHHPPPPPHRSVQFLFLLPFSPFYLCGWWKKCCGTCDTTFFKYWLSCNITSCKFPNLSPLWLLPLLLPSGAVPSEHFSLESFLDPLAAAPPQPANSKNMVLL